MSTNKKDTVRCGVRSQLSFTGLGSKFVAPPLGTCFCATCCLGHSGIGAFDQLVGKMREKWKRALPYSVNERRGTGGSFVRTFWPSYFFLNTCNGTRPSIRKVKRCFMLSVCVFFLLFLCVFMFLFFTIIGCKSTMF